MLEETEYGVEWNFTFSRDVVTVSVSNNRTSLSSPGRQTSMYVIRTKSLTHLSYEKKTDETIMSFFGDNDFSLSITVEHEVENANDKCILKVGNKEVTPEQFFALFSDCLRQKGSAGTYGKHKKES